MIEFTNVSKKYANGVIGLHNINIQIESGEFLFVIGPSGAGKSSLLKMINRQEKATGGELKVKGINVTKLSRFKVPKLRRQIGVVFQDFKLLQKMTVYQNVAFALEAIGLPGKEVREKAVKAIELVGLKGKMRFYPNQLSGGEQQRVAIARAIANNPDIIIADEPTGNLDPENSTQIVNILKKLNNEGKTIIMATHDHELIFEKDCRVITIDHGTIFSDEVRGYYEAN
ncbi:MAG: cell division ATP-binding protein FtsE [Turicibacter sp.]|nr:cell division ATP-binding protein FtsE [Turicibacter sp.]MDO5792944.1 cell division ATP-binding protein FtsE [Turicibacter sp.]